MSQDMERRLRKYLAEQEALERKLSSKNDKPLSCRPPDGKQEKRKYRLMQVNFQIARISEILDPHLP